MSAAVNPAPHGYFNGAVVRFLRWLFCGIAAASAVVLMLRGLIRPVFEGSQSPDCEVRFGHFRCLRVADTGPARSRDASPGGCLGGYPHLRRREQRRVCQELSSSHMYFSITESNRFKGPLKPMSQI